MQIPVKNDGHECRPECRNEKVKKRKGIAHEVKKKGKKKGDNSQSGGTPNMNAGPGK